MQTDFEENWDDSFTNSLDLVNVAEDINQSLKFNQGAWSSNEYKTDGEEVVVLGDYEYEGKYGDINWVEFEIVLTKDRREAIEIAPERSVAGTENVDYFYTINFGGNVDAQSERKIKNKVRTFFEQYDKKDIRKG